MEQGNSALEALLNIWSTGSWDVHGAKLLLVNLVVVVTFVGK